MSLRPSRADRLRGHGLVGLHLEETAERTGDRDSPLRMPPRWRISFARTARQKQIDEGMAADRLDDHPLGRSHPVRMAPKSKSCQSWRPAAVEARSYCGRPLLPACPSDRRALPVVARIEARVDDLKGRAGTAHLRRRLHDRRRALGVARQAKEISGSMRREGVSEAARTRTGKKTRIEQRADHRPLPRACMNRSSSHRSFRATRRESDGNHRRWR